MAVVYFTNKRGLGWALLVNEENRLRSSLVIWTIFFKGQQSQITAGGLFLFASLLFSGLSTQTIDKTRKQRVSCLKR